MGNHTAVRGRGRGGSGSSSGKSVGAARSEPPATSAAPASSPATAVPVTYDDQEQAARVGARLFGHALSDANIASLVGAQRGDQVEVYATRTELTIHLIGANDAYDAGRAIQRGRDDPYGNLMPVLYNQYFIVSKPGQGIGTRVFAEQVHAAQRLRVRAIHTEAMRGDGMNGYYTWARLGYNADIPPGLRGRLPSGLAGSTTIHDLMRTPEGRQWWKVNGITTDMTFDLTPGSDSMQMLEAYLAHRGMA